MDSKRWKRIRELTEEILASSDEVRAKLMDGLRNQDPELYEEIERLLDSADMNTGDNATWTPPDSEVESAPAYEERPGQTVGRYELLQRLGEGGFGTVWMAEQREPVRRRVALKILKPGMDTKQIVARFEAERQALAIMDHPHIAKILDGGVTDAGRPYFAMELVKGVPITDYCDREKLSTQKRLVLFQNVCSAIQHAHQKGIIHRDLKPTNVLVTLESGQAVPKVIDFGIAKALDHRLTEQTLFTEHRQILGTPEYMAPEQAEITGLDVDTRADIYSLGVLLYELLTGTKPLDLKAALQSGFAEILRHIKEVDPPKPSTRVSTVGEGSKIAECRQCEPQKLGRLLKGELDWIVMRALEKERSRRYETVGAFSQDIERHLRNQPVLARPPSSIYRLRKYVSRHRFGVASCLLIASSLILGMITTWTYYREARAYAEESAEEAKRSRRFASEAERQRIEARRQAKRAEERATVASEKGYVANIIAADQARLLNDSGEAHRRLASCPPELREWEWYHLNRETNQSGLVLDGHDEGTGALAWSPDGAWIAAASGHRIGGPVTTWGVKDSTVRIWDSRTGEVLGVLETGSGLWTGLAFSPRGDELIIAGQSDVQVWRTDTWELAETLPRLTCARLYESDVLILRDGETFTHNLKTYDRVSEELSQSTKHEGTFACQVALDPTGIHLAVIEAPSFDDLAAVLSGESSQDSIRLHERSSGHQIARLQGDWGTPMDLEFSPDGKLLGAVFGNGNVLIWTVADKRLYADFIGLRPELAHSDVPVGQGSPLTLSALAFSPSSPIVATAGVDRILTLWNWQTRELAATLRGHEQHVHELAYSPSGDRIASSSADGTVRIWQIPSKDVWVQDDDKNSIGTVWIDSRREKVLAVSKKSLRPSRDEEGKLTRPSSSELLCWDLPLLTLEKRISPPFQGASVLAVDTKSSRVLWGDGSRAELWDVFDDRLLKSFIDVFDAGPFTPDGRTLPLRTHHGLSIVEAESGRVLHTLNRAELSRVGPFSPTGSHLALRHADRLEVLDLHNERTLHPSLGETFTPKGQLAFSSDSRWLAVSEGHNQKGDPDRLVIADLKTGDVHSLEGHQRTLTSLVFTPEGKRLLGSSLDGMIRVWEPKSGKLLETMRGHEGAVYEVRLNAEGTRAFSFGFDRTIKVWKVEDAEQLLTLRGHSDWVLDGVLSADEGLLVSRTRQELRLWHAPARP